MMTLSEFLGPCRVVPDAEMTRTHRACIQDAADRLLLAGPDAGKPIRHGDGGPWMFRVIRTPGGRPINADLVAVDRGSGRVAGGIHRGLRWVNPDFRGGGLGIELCLAARSVPGVRFLSPGSYSEAGYGSRVAAHRTAVERALAAGLEVPERVLVTVRSGVRAAPAEPQAEAAAPGMSR